MTRKKCSRCCREFLDEELFNLNPGDETEMIFCCEACLLPLELDLCLIQMDFKFQISNLKSQINSKLQIPNPK